MNSNTLCYQKIALELLYRMICDGTSEMFHTFQNNRENKNMPKTEQNKSESSGSYQKCVPRSVNPCNGIAKGSLVSNFVGHPTKSDSKDS
jgi:hypothetical protein